MRKNLASVRNISDPESGSLFGGLFEQVGVVESEAGGSGRQQSHDASEERRFAHAVAAHQACARAGRYRKVDVPQRVTATIKLVKSLDLQHASRSKVNV